MTIEELLDSNVLNGEEPTEAIAHSKDGVISKIDLACVVAGVSFTHPNRFGDVVAEVRLKFKCVFELQEFISSRMFPVGMHIKSEITPTQLELFGDK